MFRKFVEEILKAETYDALMDIFYREDGIDMCFQRKKITWKDHQTLLGLIDRLVPVAKR